MGSLGKSSLATRIANRVPQHDPVYERYHALAVLEALLRPPSARRKVEVERTWGGAVAHDEHALKDAAAGPA